MKKTLALIVLTAACGGSPGQPSNIPASITVSYRTVLSGSMMDSISQAFCMHDSSPGSMIVYTDTNASARLQSLGDGSYTATLSGFSAGTHWLQVKDIGLCVETTFPWATRGFVVNGVPLTRSIMVGGIPAVTFVVTATGTITP